MALSPQDQLKNQIESAENILILAAEKPSLDTIAASWALSHLLKDLGKSPVVLQQKAGVVSFSFLAPPEKIEAEIKGADRNRADRLAGRAGRPGCPGSECHR